MLTWNFLQENEVTKGILDGLDRRFPNADAQADDVLGGRAKLGGTERSHIALCHALLRKCASSATYEYLRTVGPGLVSVPPNLMKQLADEEYVQAFCRFYVEPLFDYLDEEISSERMTLFLIRKFKHRCEWFRRAEMLAKWKAHTKKGEKILTRDLFEYLHDQGIELHLEERSASGEPDLISSQVGDDRLVADVKIFNPRKGRGLGYLAKGFRQVYHYTNDFNEPFGFLVIFKTCEDDLSILLPGREAAIPSITLNHKTIFFVVIDVFNYAAPASKRGKLKTWELKSEALIQSLAATGAGPDEDSRRDSRKTAL